MAASARALHSGHRVKGEWLTALAKSLSAACLKGSQTKTHTHVPPAPLPKERTYEEDTYKSWACEHETDLVCDPYLSIRNAQQQCKSKQKNQVSARVRATLPRSQCGTSNMS